MLGNHSHVAQFLNMDVNKPFAFVVVVVYCLCFCCPGEPVDKLYSCSKAAVVRDAAAKALYARMFQWIISRINSRLQPKDNYSKTKAPAVEDYLNIGTCTITCILVQHNSIQYCFFLLS